MMKRLSGTEIKQLELELLREFSGFCERKKLYYTLGGGTLLGAVRHRGFIPWDDDIDVLMPRPDYERLLAMRDRDLAGLPAYMKFRHWRNGSASYPFIKLVDQRTLVKEKYVEDRYACKQVWMDIFPLDANPENKRELERLYRLSLFYRKLLTLQMARRGEGRTALKRKVKPMLLSAFQNPVFKGLSVESLCFRIDNLARREEFAASRYVGGVVWGYGPGERISRSGYMKPVQLEFEGCIFNGPSNYHEYLSGLYGDYMVLPPKGDRISHEMEAYMLEDHQSGTEMPPDVGELPTPPAEKGAGVVI